MRLQHYFFSVEEGRALVYSVQPNNFLNRCEPERQASGRFGTDIVPLWQVVSGKPSTDEVEVEVDTSTLLRPSSCKTASLHHIL